MIEGLFQHGKSFCLRSRSSYLHFCGTCGNVLFQLFPSKLLQIVATLYKFVKLLLFLVYFPLRNFAVTAVFQYAVVVFYLFRQVCFQCVVLRNLRAKLTYVFFKVGGSYLFHVQPFQVKFHLQFAVQLVVLSAFAFVQPLRLFQFQTFFENFLFHGLLGFRKHVALAFHVPQVVTEIRHSLFDVVASRLLFSLFRGLTYLRFVYFHGFLRFHYGGVDVVKFGIDLFQLTVRRKVLFVSGGKASAYVGKGFLYFVVGGNEGVHRVFCPLQLQLRIGEILQTGFKCAHLCP